MELPQASRPQALLTESQSSQESTGDLNRLSSAPMLIGDLGLFMIRLGNVPTTYVKTLMVAITSETTVEMKHIEVVLNTNSKKGRLDAMNDGLRSVLDSDSHGRREVHCARFDQIQDALSEVEDEFVSGPYYVFFCEWSAQERLVNPMKLMTKTSLWLQEHDYIRGPIAFVRASHLVARAAESFAQSAGRETRTYQFKDILDMPRTMGNAKLNEMICQRLYHRPTKVLHHEPDGCDSCGPVDVGRLQWRHDVTIALGEGAPVPPRYLPRTG